MIYRAHTREHAITLWLHTQVKKPKSIFKHRTLHPLTSQKPWKRQRMRPIIETKSTMIKKMSTCAISNISTSSEGVPKI
jgi:shikimate kinase